MRICAESTVFHLTVSLSVASTTAHIPYVRPILDTLTGKNGAFTRLREFGRERVRMRLEAGANRKDLFYHLVRPYVESDIFTSLRPISER